MVPAEAKRPIDASSPGVGPVLTPLTSFQSGLSLKSGLTVTDNANPLRQVPKSVLPRGAPSQPLPKKAAGGSTMLPSTGVGASSTGVGVAAHQQHGGSSSQPQHFSHHQVQGATPKAGGKTSGPHKGAGKLRLLPGSNPSSNGLNPAAVAFTPQPQVQYVQMHPQYAAAGVVPPQQVGYFAARPGVPVPPQQPYTRTGPYVVGGAVGGAGAGGVAPPHYGQPQQHAYYPPQQHPRQYYPPQRGSY